MDDQTYSKMAQFLAAEYAALQNARNAVVVESNGRAASFLTTISAGVVSLALVSQASRFGEAFLIFALVLLPVMGFVGLSAYARLVQLDFTDIVYTAAINRIRRFFYENTPEIEHYASFPGFDDERSVLRSRVIHTSFVWTVISYPSGMVLAVNSLLAGVLASVLVTALFQAQLWLTVAVGVVVFGLAAGLQYRLGLKFGADVRAEFQPRFPTQ